MRPVAPHCALLLVLLVSSPSVAVGEICCAPSKERLVLEEATDEIITTTVCPKILDPAQYVARLDLSYIYSLDFPESGESNQSGTVAEQQKQLLLSVERAIATSVASTLHQCNAQQQPVYAVQISSDDGTVPNVQKHVIIPFSNNSSFNATCLSVSTSSPQENSLNKSSSLSQCLLVRGVTSILLEESGANQNVSAIDSLVYTLIEATLGNVHFLNQFVVTQPLLKNVQLTFSEFIQSTGGNFIVLPRQSKQSGSVSGTLMVAIAAAIIVLGLTVTALLLIILCRQHKIHRDRNSSDANELAKRNGIVAKSRRRRDPFSFEVLEDICSTNDPDDSLPHGWMVVTNTDAPVANHLEASSQGTTISRVVATAWSDLTSDSESIMSSLHLDRIDEEVGECSYEQDDNVGVNDDRGNHINHFAGQNDYDNVEVSIGNKNWDDEVGSWPSSILPLSLSRHHLIPGNDMFNAIVNRHGIVEPNCDSDLNIEVSLDRDIMYSSTIALNSETIEVREKWKDRGDTSQSFTFSSDSDTNPTSYDAYVKPLNDENARIRTSKTEHFYDDEDFQSIEMCVVWVDEDIGEPEEKRCSTENLGGTTFPTPSGPDVLLGCQISNHENDASLGYDTVSVEGKFVSTNVPPSVSQSLIPPESDITDTNDLLKSTFGTESTWSNVYTFSSSDAYRSDLEVNSNPTPTGKHPKGPADSNSRAAIAHWAREVMIRLMSGSPKMLHCGTEMEFNSNDSESL
jgi:hypothetical protein